MEPWRPINFAVLKDSVNDSQSSYQSMAKTKKCTAQRWNRKFSSQKRNIWEVIFLEVSSLWIILSHQNPVIFLALLHHARETETSICWWRNVCLSCIMWLPWDEDQVQKLTERSLSEKKGPKSKTFRKEEPSLEKGTFHPLNRGKITLMKKRVGTSFGGLEFKIYIERRGQ
jgi:hypothetical protein